MTRRGTSRAILPVVATLVLTTAAAAGQGLGQDLAVPADDPDITRLLDSVRASEPETLADQVALCEIPAPPFLERDRAIEYRRRLEAIGLSSVRIDTEGNVLGELPGVEPAPVVVLSAHLDTVFPEGTDVSVAREGDVLTGPGIVDDCRGLAVVLAVARELVRSDLRPRGTVVFVGTVGEEGPGNLRGVRHLFATELKDRIDYFISVDGAGSSYTHEAVGSRRYKIEYRGPGGHSLHAFGMPNPAHALGRAIAKIADLQVPDTPKVTFNVGVIDGGTSVNSIPFAATMWVDIRSTDPDWLERMDRDLRERLLKALDEENARWRSDVRLTMDVEVIGVRPTGRQPAESAIVRAAVTAAKAAGLEPVATAASTDANIPISLGIPAVTIDGGGEGTGAHSPAVESFDTRDSHRGTRWALLLVLALAGVDR